MSTSNESANSTPAITDDESDCNEDSLPDYSSHNIVQSADSSFDESQELHTILDDSLQGLSSLSIEDPAAVNGSKSSRKCNVFQSDSEDEPLFESGASAANELQPSASDSFEPRRSKNEQKRFEHFSDYKNDKPPSQKKSPASQQQQSFNEPNTSSPSVLVKFSKKKVRAIESDSENDDSSPVNTRVHQKHLESPPPRLSESKNNVSRGMAGSVKVESQSQIKSRISNHSDTQSSQSVQKSTKKKNRIFIDSESESDEAVPKLPNKTSLSSASIQQRYSNSPSRSILKRSTDSKKKMNVIESDSDEDHAPPAKPSVNTTPSATLQTQDCNFESSVSSLPSSTRIVESAVDFTKESMLTPRTKRAVVIDSDSSVDDSNSDGIIEVSSDDEPNIPRTPKNPLFPKLESIPAKPAMNKSVIRQVTLDSLVRKMQEDRKNVLPNENEAKPVDVNDPNSVTPEQYQKQADSIRQLESDLQKAKNLLRTLNISALPDKGELLIKRHKNLENTLKLEKEKLEKMVVRNCDGPGYDGNHHHHHGGKKEILSWEEIEAGASAVMPKTFGKKGLSTYNAQKALTLDRLEQLHSSLKGRPQDSKEATDPRGLKVELMPHQKRALTWMMWREQQNPSGGILADDMGLGKTLTMISLMLKTKEGKENIDDPEDELNQNRKSAKCSGGTLVVCPASLINQWSGELESKANRGLASYEVYHGPKRETKPKRLAEHDMVITTYSIIMNECERNGAVFKVRWRRIILDEAHQIRNHKSQTSEAVCKLSAKSRWALTGTPVHNKELDMYALLKFLRCTPFDDLNVWKRWVGERSTGGQERLHTVISSLLLRRTKAELIEKGGLQGLPQRDWELISVTLQKEEMDVYSKILLFSKTLFAQFLHQHAEKSQDRVDFDYKNYKNVANDPNSEYFKMRRNLLKFNNIREVKQHEILVLLLRLRQICCHPSLIINMLHGDEDLGSNENPEDIEEMNLLEQINKMSLDDAGSQEVPDINREEVGLKEACKNILNPSNPIFSDKTKTSKIKIILDVLKRNVLTRNDKAVIVSQWTSLLNIVGVHLEKEGLRFERLDGSVPVNKRMAIVNTINDPNSKVKILLLSLTAGGVGLNLVGANHLLLLDLHWNPQLENQAQDRIYRVGQKKPVHIYKFMAVSTIEERIKDLQDMKLGKAEAMLTGTKQVASNKLSLNDLKLLFEM